MIFFIDCFVVGVVDEVFFYGCDFFLVEVCYVWVFFCICFGYFDFVFGVYFECCFCGCVGCGEEVVVLSVYFVELFFDEGLVYGVFFERCFLLVCLLNDFN